MADIKENEPTPAQEGSIELIEPSDTLADQCQPATIASTRLTRAKLADKFRVTPATH